MSANPIPIVCHGCGARGSVNKVTANLRCRCGSTDLDIDEDREVTGAVHQAKPLGPGTGWGEPHSSPTRGWSSYEGPNVGRNPITSPPVNDSMICPACHGSGWDPVDSTVTCRECNGAGKINPPTGQPARENWDATNQQVRPGGAGWHGASAQSGRRSSDPFGSVEDHIRATTPGYSERGSGAVDVMTEHPDAQPNSLHRDYSAPTGRAYQMDSAMCPNCGHSPTELRKDSKEDAWWHCPTCGPLANIDRHPEIDPYNPPEDFVPDRSMKTGKLAALGRKTGKLLRIAKTVSDANSGLTDAQVIGLSRRTLALEQG